MLRILTRLWSEDSSTPVSLESRNQPKKGKPKQDQQNKQQPEKAKSNTNQRNKGGRGQVLKNLTRLWPGSSSTLTGDKWNRKSPNTQEIKVRQHSRGGAALQTVLQGAPLDCSTIYSFGRLSQKTQPTTQSHKEHKLRRNKRIQEKNPPEEGIAKEEGQKQGPQRAPKDSRPYSP